MSKRETIFEPSDPETIDRRHCTMRIDPDLHAQVQNIARKCMLSDREVLSRIVRDALPFVTLRERKVYEFSFKNE